MGVALVRMRIAVLYLAVVAVALGGCGSQPESQAPRDIQSGPSEEDTVTDEAPSLGQIAPPGLYQLPDGTLQALGILNFRDVEGGIWVVARTGVPEEAAVAPIVAVVKLEDDLAVDLQTMNGTYVSVRGTADDDSAAGPMIEATSVEVVSDMVVR